MCECKSNDATKCAHFNDYRCNQYVKPTPHVHAALIKAWADGALIQYRQSMTAPWRDVGDPIWVPEFLYRIKPPPKSDVVLYANIQETSDGYHTAIGSIRLCGSFNDLLCKTDNIKITYDGETGALKNVEMIK